MRICVSLENSRKDRNWLIAALCNRRLGVTTQFREYRIGSPIGIHHEPVDLLHGFDHLLELASHLLLKRVDLVSLLSESASPLLLFRIEVEEENKIGRRKTPIRGEAPVDVVSLCGCKRNAAGEVAIANDGNAVPQVLQNAVSRLPAIRREEKVDTVVFHVAFVLKILVDLLSDDRFPIFRWIIPNEHVLGNAYDFAGTPRVVNH